MKLKSPRTAQLRAVTMALLIGFAAVEAGAASNDAVTKAIAAAVADPDRPVTDRARDANRKPAEVLKFAGVKPGDKVAEFLPGQFYYTRLLSKLVGPKGHVYVLVRLAGRPNPLAGNPEYANVSIVAFKESIDLPAPVDVVWTSDNYHDFFNIPGVNPAALDPQVLASVKPGGVYFILDHRSARGSGAQDTARLHRIDPEIVKADVLAAGFELEASSDLLQRSTDPHTGSARDAAIHDMTDQFIFKFRRPKASKQVGF